MLLKVHFKVPKIFSYHSGNLIFTVKQYPGLQEMLLNIPDLFFFSYFEFVECETTLSLQKPPGTILKTPGRPLKLI